MKFLRILAIFFAWGFTSLMLATWAQAALSDSYSITIYVNRFNELWWEAILIPIAWLLVTWYLVGALRRE